MGPIWKRARNRLILIGCIGALATLVSLLPGSFLCALGHQAGEVCGKLDRLELAGSIALTLFGWGTALAIHRLLVLD